MGIKALIEKFTYPKEKEQTKELPEDIGQLISQLSSNVLVIMEYTGPSPEALRYARIHQSRVCFSEKIKWGTETEGVEARKKLSSLYLDSKLTLKERYKIGRALGKLPLQIYETHATLRDTIELHSASIREGFDLRTHWQKE